MVIIDKSSIIGIILGFVALIGGMIAKGADPSMLLAPAAVIIIFGGTAAAVIIAFPLEEIKKFPKLLRIVFTDKEKISEEELVITFSNWAKIVRKEGVMGLEKEAENIHYPLLATGVDLVLEGKQSDVVTRSLEDMLDNVEERHSGYASIFSQAGSYAPTLGVLGAVMGLVSALGNLDDIDKLGHSISAAFMATIYGIFLGYVICHPIANKLKRKSKIEIDIGNIIIRGISILQENPSPKVVQDTLLPLIPAAKRAAIIEKLNSEPNTAGGGANE